MPNFTRSSSHYSHALKSADAGSPEAQRCSPRSVVGSGCTPVLAHPGASTPSLPRHKNTQDARGSSKSSRSTPHRATEPLPAHPGDAAAQTAAWPCREFNQGPPHSPEQGAALTAQLSHAGDAAEDNTKEKATYLLLLRYWRSGKFVEPSQGFGSFFGSQVELDLKIWPRPSVFIQLCRVNGEGPEASS